MIAIHESGLAFEEEQRLRVESKRMRKQEFEQDALARSEATTTGFVPRFPVSEII